MLGTCKMAGCGTTKMQGDDPGGNISVQWEPVVQGIWTDLVLDAYLDATLNATDNLRDAYDTPVARHFYCKLFFPSTYNKSLYGVPAFAAINLTVLPASAKTTLICDLQFFGKPSTRMAEALWMTFAPLVPAASDMNWRMDKPGRWWTHLVSAATDLKICMQCGPVSGIYETMSASDIVIEMTDAALVSPTSIALPSGFSAESHPGQAGIST